MKTQPQKQTEHVAEYQKSQGYYPDSKTLRKWNDNPTRLPEQQIHDLIRRAIEGDYIPKHEIMILGFALKTVRTQRDELLAALQNLIVEGGPNSDRQRCQAACNVARAAIAKCEASK